MSVYHVVKQQSTSVRSASHLAVKCVIIFGTHTDSEDIIQLL